MSERSSLGFGLPILGALLIGLASLESNLVAGREDTGTLHPFSESMGAVGMGVADWNWLQAYLAWERRDESELRDRLRVVRAFQPEREYFLLNAARMLAYDVPTWRLAAQPAVPETVATRWRTDAAAEAIAWLAADTSRRSAVVIEAANIALHGARDSGLAIEYFGRAARLADTPWHAGRIHARLLLDSGRRQEAADFLRQWLPRLPQDDPSAQRELVGRWLAALEREGF